MPLRIRRGTDAERLTITPLEGELIYTTDTKLVYVGDGTTVGGLDVSTGTGAFGGLLGQSLDLNGFDIIGLGDINTIGNQNLSGNLEVSGTITAQGNIIANGNIILGAGGGDVIIIDGDIDSNIVPGSNQYSLGSPDKPWGTLYVNGIQAGGLINGDLEGNLRASDSSISFDSTTNTFFGNFSGELKGDLIAVNNALSFDSITNTFFGDFEGNLRASDSSTAFDSITNTFFGNFSGGLKGDLIAVNNALSFDSTTNTFFGNFNGTLIGNVFGDVYGTHFGDVEGNILGFDSSIAYDASMGTFYGNFDGNLVGNLKGSVFADNSTLLVDAIESAFYTTSLKIKDSTFTSNNASINFGDNLSFTTFNFNSISDNLSNYFSLTGASHKHNIFKDNIGSVTALANGDTLLVEVVNAQDGVGTTQAGVFGFVVDNAVSPGNVPGKFVAGSYANGNPNWLTFSSQGKLAVNKFDATETLDVEGNGLFSGSVTAAAFKGSFVADDSSIIVDGVSGSVTAPTVTASTFVQFPVYANPTTRNAAIPSPAAGMVVFVTDSTGAGGPPKLQANTDGTTGGWVDL